MPCAHITRVRYLRVRLVWALRLIGLESVLSTVWSETDGSCIEINNPRAVSLPQPQVKPVDTGLVLPMQTLGVGTSFDSETF